MADQSKTYKVWREQLEAILDEENFQKLYEVYDPSTGERVIVQGSYAAYALVWDGFGLSAKYNGKQIKQVDTKAAKVLYGRK